MLLAYLASALACATIAHANTEIINFRASYNRAVPPSSALLSHALPIHPGNHEHSVELIPAPLGTSLEHVCDSLKLCESESWLLLDLDAEEWHKYEKFTLRVSWPGSSPTDFRIDIHTPPDLPPHFAIPNNSTYPTHLDYTRQSYARIRLVNTGVRPSLHNLRDFAKPVAFMVTLEPLVLGAIPQSLLPTLGLLSALLPLSLFVARGIHSVLASAATDAHRELASLKHKSL